MEKDLWNKDNIQFPRLIAELDNIDVFCNMEVMEQLSNNMDLSKKDILDLVDRAINNFDKIKEKLCKI